MRSLKGPIFIAHCILIAWGLSGCVQTVDRPPIRLPQSVMPAPIPASQSRMVASSGHAIDAAVAALAQDLIANAPASLRRKRIAVLPMRDLSGEAEALAQTANDSFKVALFRAAPLQYVADNDMKRAIQELGIEAKLRRQGRLDSAVLDSLGKLLSAELIVDSRITDSFTELRLTAEIIEISTGLLLVPAQQLLSKSVLENSRVQGAVSRQSGRILAAGDDWLQTRLEDVRMDNDRVIRAKFSFINRSQAPVRLTIADPKRKAYIVDSNGDTALYLGTQGLDPSGTLWIRPEARHEVEVLFSASRPTHGTLTMRTSWQASGMSRSEQEFVVRDLVMGR